MMTFLAPPLVMWLTAPLTVLPFLLTPSFLMVNRPVDSIDDVHAQVSPRNGVPGSVSLKTLTFLPSISRPSSTISTVPLKRP